MIKLSDYNVIQCYCVQQSHKKKPFQKKQVPFNQLYPLQNSSTYISETKQLIVLKHCNQPHILQQLKQLSTHSIFSRKQSLYILKSKDNHMELILLIVKSQQRFYLDKTVEDCFQREMVVATEAFCKLFIHKFIRFIQLFQAIANAITFVAPKYIIISEDDIYLSFQFIVDLLNDNNCFLNNKIPEVQQFLAPELLKLIQKNRELKQNSAQIVNQSRQITNKNIQDKQINQQVRQYKKSILYSIGLCILFLFNFKIPLQERYSCLSRARPLTHNYNQLRKEIKAYHQGKYISKILKLLLQQSQTLRQSVDTFLIKINSAQFKFLQRQEENKTQDKKIQTIKTQSQFNQTGMPRITKRTVDIRISSISNASTLINRSWITKSNQRHAQNSNDCQQRQDNHKNYDNYHDTNNEIQKQKPYQQKFSKSKISMKELNLITEQNQHSFVDIDVDWSQSNYSRHTIESYKKSIQEQQNSCWIKHQNNSSQYNSFQLNITQDNYIENVEKELSKTFTKDKQQNQIILLKKLSESQKGNKVKECLPYQQMEKVEILQKHKQIAKSQIMQMNSLMLLRKEEQMVQVITEQGNSIDKQKQNKNSEQTQQFLIISPNQIFLDNESKILSSQLNDSLHHRQIHKYLLKKDKYNQRSRIIIITLMVIYLVYKTLQYVLHEQYK